jgi:hypothetical protein
VPPHILGGSTSDDQEKTRQAAENRAHAALPSFAPSSRA